MNAGDRWLTSFYAMFHCWLNFLSEITCYADRMFYDDCKLSIIGFLFILRHIAQRVEFRYTR